MKINFLITLVLVTTIELCQGYGYAKQHLTTNSAITQANHKFWTGDDVRTPTTPTPAKRRVVRGVFFYTYDDNYNGREIEMHELNPQTFNKLISSNDYAKKPAAIKSLYNFIEFFDGRCEATIRCEREPVECTKEPCVCSTTPMPSTVTPPRPPPSTPKPSTVTPHIDPTTTPKPTTTSKPDTTTPPTTTTKPDPTTTPRSTTTFRSTTTPPTTTTPRSTTTFRTTTTPPTTSRPTRRSTPSILYPPPTKRGSRVFPSYPTKSYGSIRWPTRRSYTWSYPTRWTTRSTRSFTRPKIIIDNVYPYEHFIGGESFVGK